MDDATLKAMLAAAWQAGSDATSSYLLTSVANAERVGFKKAIEDATPPKNPYK